MPTNTMPVALTKKEFISGAMILAVILAGLFFAFVQNQVLYGIHMQSDWGHTLVVPFICVYLAYIKRGEIFGIAGVQGNGQDALIRAIAGLSEHTAGKILLSGRDISRLPPRPASA